MKIRSHGEWKRIAVDMFLPRVINGNEQEILRRADSMRITHLIGREMGNTVLLRFAWID